MKRILTLLVLGIVPILMATAVVDEGLAADKGSQLIFQSNMAHKNFISVANAHDKQAVTVLTQYYNDEMKLVLWYLRVLAADSNLLVDPFDHMIPGTASDDDMDGTNVSEVLGALPAMSTDKKAGMNSGHFVIAITAVGASIGIDDASATGDADTLVNVAAERNQGETANILFPTFLAKDMHGTDNIDNCGSIVLTDSNDSATTADQKNLTHSMHGEKGVDDCSDGTGTRAGTAIPKDPTSKNVGDLSVDNAQPVSFNHLTGHFTEALLSTDTGGADQTASWGGTPIIRPAVASTANMGLARDVDTGADAATTNSDYQVLDGGDEDTTAEPSDTAEGLDGGRLAEKDAGGAESLDYHNVDGYEAEGDNKIVDTDTCDLTATPPTGCRENRGLDMGALVLPALHGGGAMAHQIMLMLSAADDFGGAGKYKLMAAKTGFAVTLMDGMGDALENPAAESGPIFGGTDDPETPAGTHIIVEGIRVMTDADLAKCTGTMIMGPWMLTSLTDIVPTASTGAKKFAGLDAMTDPMMSASPGWIKFKRSSLTCKKDYGDGDAASGSTVEDADGVPTKDERTYTAGTLVVEEKQTDRAYVTTGQALLKFINPASTFAASWSLKSPPSPAN